jgi:hypothetical protein
VKRGLAPLLFLVVALGCRKSPSTPTGTEILSWDAVHAKRRSAALAGALGPQTAHDMRIVARPEHKGPVTLALHLVTAPLEVVEDGRTSHRRVPVVVRASVEANADWWLAGRCWDGPEDSLPTLVDGKLVPSDVMLLTCRVHMRHEDAWSDLDASLAIEVRGDGAATASLTGGSASVE